MHKHDGFCEQTRTSNHNQSGFAVIMNKILHTRKPRRKKTVVLAKAKKLSAKQAIEGLKNVSNDEELLPSHQVKNSDWISKGRLKPNPIDKNYEKRLLKITISGVVNLFNAVNQYKNNSAKSDPVSKTGNLKLVDKSKFLRILLNGTEASEKENGENNHVQLKSDDSENFSDTWNVLRKDFVNDNNLIHWDKTLSDNKR